MRRFVAIQKALSEHLDIENCFLAPPLARSVLLLLYCYFEDSLSKQTLHSNVLMYGLPRRFELFFFQCDLDKGSPERFSLILNTRLILDELSQVAQARWF